MPAPITNTVDVTDRLLDSGHERRVDEKRSLIALSEKDEDKESLQTGVARDSYGAMSTWSGQPSVKGSSESMRMALLTFSLVGLQYVQLLLAMGLGLTTLCEDCTPYLLALGLTKSGTSLVWIAGPISGLIMQPIVGVIADRSKSKYGRRRPFMVVGSILTAICLLTLGWAKEIASYLVEEGESRKFWRIVVAILSIYGIDFAVNAVQASCRALIVDTLPIAKQQLGSAWGGRMVSSGHLVGYFIGTLDLVKLLGPSYGETQFKKLCLISASVLLFTNGVTSWAVSERILVSGKDVDEPINGIQIVKKVFKATTSLPPKIQAICNVQLWSWIGWFPFHMYSTTFIGEIYFRYNAPHDVKVSKDALGDMGRIGSLSLVIFSLVNFLAALILPTFIRSPDEEDFTARPPAAIAGIMDKINKYKPDLLTCWLYAHILFTSLMIFTPFTTSFKFASFLVAMCGLSWFISCWAPSTFMGIEVNRISPNGTRRGSTSGIDLTPLSPTLPRTREDSSTSSAGELSGLYFGILNIYTTIPQFIGTFISMIVFGILEPGKSPELAHDAHPSEHHSTDGPNAISICLLIGAGSMIGAAVMTRRLIRLYQ